MRPIHILLTLINLLRFAEPSCLEFWRNWKTCPQEQFPDISRDKLLCFHKLNYASEVLISRESEKQSAVICHNRTFPSDIFDCLPIKDSLLLILKNCPFPPPKFDKIFGTENSTLKGLQIQYENSELLQKSIYVTGIPHLQMLSLSGKLIASDFNLFLGSLPSLMFLTINNHSFTTLPEMLFKNVPSLQSLTISEGNLEFLRNEVFSGINLVVLDLSQNRLKMFSPKLLMNLGNLKKLNLSHNYIETIEEVVFEKTPDLEIVTLDHNKLVSLPVGLFSKTPNITVIFLNQNRLKTVPQMIFNHLYHLQLLSLDNNRLTVLPPNIFNNLVSLVWLDLQFNQISTLPDNVFSQLMRLQVLDLSNNNISSLPSYLAFGESRFLSKINMSGNRLEQFPEIYWSQYNLTQLDLSYNLIRQIVLPVKIRPGTSIFLQNNQIASVKVDRILRNAARYFLNGNPFDCICSLDEFIHFMPHLSIGDVETLKCRTPWYRNHKYLKEFKAVSQLCETRDYCPSSCQCHLSIENTVTLDCSNSKMNESPRSIPLHTTIMHYENNDLSFLNSSDSDWLEVTHLYLTNNSLTSLQNWTIPPKLQVLAIDGNKLTDLSSSLMKTVDESSSFRIRMADNKWLCDCNSVHLKKWLMRNLPKVQDSMYVYCNNSDRSKQTSLIVETRIEEFICSGVLKNTWVKNQLYITAFVILSLIEQFQNKLL